MSDKTTKVQNISLCDNRELNPKVLIGILYCDEQDFEQCIETLEAQTFNNHDHFLIENLPNKLAHDTLYSEFMAKSESCDFFLKLDADMAFKSNTALQEMVEACTKNQLAHLFAYVYDCPSEIAIPGIQMFASSTKWLGSDEQLYVDYPPIISGRSQHFVNKPWINHMPNPSDYQLFRYGIHKALKSLQPDRQKKNTKKGILHLSILNGIARNVFAGKNDKLWLALIGATLVYDKQYVEHQYNTEQTKTLFDEILNNQNLYEQHKKLAKAFWVNEIQTTYWWLENFNNFSN